MGTTEETKNLMTEHLASLEILKSLAKRKCEHDIIRYQTKVCVGIHESIMSSICGPDWKNGGLKETENKI